MLTLHRAERTDTLADALADILLDPLADALTPEIVAVPAKGVERWLGQRLSARLGTSDAGADGIAANIDFRSPTDLVDRVLGSIRGYHRADDPWSPARMRWTLLGVLDTAVHDPGCEVLARHLGVRPDGSVDGHRAGRRWSTAVGLTRTFRSYAAQRPQMLSDWAAGHDTDGIGGELPTDQRWQAHVWRRLRERIGFPGPAERLESLCAQITSEPAALDLPRRLSLFGPTRLTTEALAVLSAVGSARDVHIFLPHPSDRLWQATAAAGEPVRRRDLVRGGVSNPLLASLSREIRETQLRLSRHVTHDVHHAGPIAKPTTLLARLQQTIRDDVAVTDLTPGPMDDSVGVHSCHGPTRQVEVIRDVLARLFTDDPTLMPRDVIVMCPDIEAFAPLIRAAFDSRRFDGRGPDVDGHPAHRLRVRLADRSMSATNTVLESVVVVVALAGARVTAGDIADLAGRAPVRTRFGFTDDDLELIGRWMAEAGVRWGLGAAQRTAFGLKGFEQNTMETGLDRIVLGVVAHEAGLQWIHRALPLDDIDSADIDLVGRFAEFVDRLDACVGALTGVRSARDWTEAMVRVIDDLLDVAPADSWQRAQAVDEITRATEHCGEVDLRRADVVALLDDVVAARPTRANFRTGELTVCSMVPMRAVPHRVVVLIGLDDDVYPRVSREDGDDVLDRNPCVGERDPRSEDRQLLLDTIMSAQEKLVIAYTGADPVTGLRRPPSVPVSEVVDALTALVTPTQADRVVRRHPLHAFDPANFDAASPFGFDRSALAGARALIAPPTHTIEFDRTPLPPVTSTGAAASAVDVSELIAFFEHPVRGFCRQRLGFAVPDTAEVLDDELDPGLDPLDRWGIGDRLLRHRLQGDTIEALRGAELRRGTLPPFELGRQALEPVLDDVERLWDAASATVATERTSVDVDVDLGDGRRLIGTVDGVHGDVVFRAHYSKLAPKHRLSTWIAMLAAAAARTDGAMTGLTIGRFGKGTRLARAQLALPAAPAQILADLVRLRDLGLTHPLALPAAAGAEYAVRRHGGDSVADALEAARAAFDATFGEHADRYLKLVFPTGFAGIAADPGATDEFIASAESIWHPMLDAEQVVVR
ncbi:exodeoxyribonuclease V subunit gamma [Williamsia phyllosphaerae]|uniref:RecBCD enzyme subunit RecC n=1 Tax=Williamsia phyllosphaerae TaxID=885042 RepID=A0ABQ1V860_9NOCA|nr:exodeoxyribonuclease V subunit gamma [Williamsia phyllosphaerae]GGF43664.1 RecBCD enzyme subunit RecC [Williamsia phyllosphaerae]